MVGSGDKIYVIILKQFKIEIQKRKTISKRKVQFKQREYNVDTLDKYQAWRRHLIVH